MKIKVLSIFGTRPEAIKMAPVIAELNNRDDEVESVVCVTAQHREMLDQVLDTFRIEPDYDLDIMSAGQNLFDITATTLVRIQEVLTKENPSVVLVQGDTTTTFVASLSAYYQRIPSGHIEAGLRTFDKYNPFPEEINRALVSLLADYHFAPTERARQNLLRSGIAEDQAYVTGNTIVDALQSIVKDDYVFDAPDLAALDFERSKVIILTSHRRESFGRHMENIFAAVRQIAEKNADVKVVFPVHPNPHVQRAVKKTLNGVDRVIIAEPLPYEPFIQLLSKSYLILTDSGGVQEEAPSLGKPVLVLRATTERPEGVEAGVAKLVGTEKAAIMDSVQRLLDDPVEYRKMVGSENPYGDGHAAERIVEILLKVLHDREP